MKKTRNSRQAQSGSEQMSFLPAPDFNPIIPPNNTLPHHAVSMMLNGEKLTHPYFQNKTGSWRLAAAIEVLANDMGWPIEREDVEHCSAKKPQRRIITRYSLSPKTIKKFKNQGGVI